MPHLILILIVLVALVVLVRWIFRRPEAALSTLPLSPASALEDGQICKLVGTVRLEPGSEPLHGPCSDREALVCITRLYREADPGAADLLRQLRCVPVFRLEDETGAALVRPEESGLKPTLRLAGSNEKVLRLWPMEQVDALLQSEGKNRQSVQIPAEASRLPDSLSIAENVLQDGERVVVVGPCSRHEGELPRIGPGKGKMLFISNDEAIIAEMVRGAMSSAQDATRPEEPSN